MPNSVTVELPDLPRNPTSPQARGEMAGNQPMRGITILAVEDSRFASEALRLMCRRLGVRLRRAESLQAAKSHLRLYRPNVVIVDLGLPDGRGEALIADIARQSSAPVVLGTSGDADGRALALAAGAQGYLDKPLESFAAFQALLVHHLPEQMTSYPGSTEADMPLTPDALALRDDFARAAALIDAQADFGPQDQAERYLSSFVSGVARHAHDPDLAEAARRTSALPLAGRFDHLRQLLAGRLAAANSGFGTQDGSET